MNVIITGAGRGIGRAIVQELARNCDNNILALSRNANSLMQLSHDCDSLPGELITASFDLEGGNLRQELTNIIEKSNFTTIHSLVNNAGQIVNKSFQELTLEEVYLCYQVNVIAIFSIIQSVIPYMKGEWGHVVNISSMGGVQGSAKYSGLSAYSSSKAALCGLTECLAEEFKDTIVKFNCLALGAVQTEMLENAFPGYKAPLTPESMAKFICAFINTGYQYFNGKIIPVSTSTP